MNAKYIFVVALTIFAVTQCNAGKDLKKISEDCIKETGVDAALVEKAHKGEFEDGNDMKCFAKCVFLKSDFMNENGDLDVAAMKAVAESEGDKETRLKIVDECLKNTGNDACDTAHKIHRCWYEQLKKHNLH